MLDEDVTQPAPGSPPRPVPLPPGAADAAALDGLPSYATPLASPKGKRVVDLNKVLGELKIDTGAAQHTLPATRPARAVLFAESGATEQPGAAPVDHDAAGAADERPLADGRNDSGVDLADPSSGRTVVLVRESQLSLQLTSSSPQPLAAKDLKFESPDGSDASEVLWLPTSPPQSPSTPPLRSALKSPSPSRASSRSASPSPKIVHFSPTHQVRHFFLSDPPADCSEPVAVRYTLRSMIPVQFGHPPVRLDSVRLPDDHAPKLEGRILVRNLAFDKRVFVRYTSDRWDTYDETAAVYVSGDGYTDNWRFDVDLTGSLHNDKVTTEYQVAIQAIIGNQTYWDNNQGRNYDLSVTRRVAEEEERPDLPALELGPAHEDEPEERRLAYKMLDSQVPPVSPVDDDELELEEESAGAFRSLQARGRQGSIIPRTKRVILTQPPPPIPSDNPFFPPLAPSPVPSPSQAALIASARPTSPITPPSAGGPPTATLASVGTPPPQPPPGASAFFGGLTPENYAKIFSAAPPPSSGDAGGGRRGSDVPPPQGLSEMSNQASVVY
ncbi:putative phosphatase regulatory subunit-domain-containing protein [Hyaloraphidium curvatum]|nr:putative phosphatase regulatory subunit-domain-containing protein [Hyaloraphidium curvatum]